jgi:hypothetical protein
MPSQLGMKKNDFLRQVVAQSRQAFDSLNSSTKRASRSMIPLHGQPQQAQRADRDWERDMAGRPKKMAQRATELDTLAFAFSLEVFAAAPAQYRDEDSDPKDAIGTLWKRCVTDAILLSLHIELLADLLRAKVGLSSIADLDAEDEAEGGTAGGEEPVDRITEGEGEEAGQEEPTLGAGMFEQVLTEARELKIARQVAKG